MWKEGTDKNIADWGQIAIKKTAWTKWRMKKSVTEALQAEAKIREEIQSVFSLKTEDLVSKRLYPLSWMWDESMDNIYMIDWEIREFDWESVEVYSSFNIDMEKKSAWIEIESDRVLIWKYPKLTEKEALEALDAAVKAYDDGEWKWPSADPDERIEMMLGFMNHMYLNKKWIVELLMAEIWKNREDAEKEFDRTIEYIVETVQTYNEMIKEAWEIREVWWLLTKKILTPTWPTLCMGPYNYPLNETFTTLIPALLSWNTIIYKPAKFWVLFNAYLMHSFMECFPKWVVNVITWEWKTIIPPIMESWKIVNFAFIWTDRVADDLVKKHPYPHILNPVLWLGAKNPWIIMPGCDINNAVDHSLSWNLSYNWQRCTAHKINFLHTSIKEEFLTKYLEKFSKLKFWYPFAEWSKFTPIPDSSHIEYLKRLLNDAVSKWAKIMNPGWWYVYWLYMHPAILTWVTPDMDIYHLEQFGPIVPFVDYKDINEVKEYVKKSRYGQQASIFYWDESNEKEVKDMKRFLVRQVWRLNENTQCQRSPDSLPFSWRKHSALRILSLRDAIEEFTMPVVVAASAKGGTVGKWL